MIRTATPQSYGLVPNKRNREFEFTPLVVETRSASRKTHLLILILILLFGGGGGYYAYGPYGGIGIGGIVLIILVVLALTGRL